MRAADSERLFEHADAVRSRRFVISYSSIAAAAAIVDVALILVTSAVAGVLFNAVSDEFDTRYGNLIEIGCIVALLIVPRKIMRGHYRPLELLHLRRQMLRITSEWLFAAACLVGLAFAFKAGASFSRGACFTFAVLGLLALMLQRVVWYEAVQLALKSGRLRGRRAALVGTRSAIDDRELATTLRAHGYDLLWLMSPPEDGNATPADWRSFLESVDCKARGTDLEEIFIRAGWEQARPLMSQIDTLRMIPLPVYLIPDVELGSLLTRPPRSPSTPAGCIQLQRAPLSLAERAAKRLLDVTIAGGALLILTPLLSFVALAIKLDSSGPVFFRQTRRGFNSRPFTIFKFRSMTVMEDGDDVRQAQKEDPRVTRVGRILRRSSVDELPQLINVLRGEMSLVGPRPHAVAHDNYYDKLISNYARRHNVKPGLAGWAQIKGFRGETPTVELMAQRVEFDIWYIDHWSLALDVRIIFRTAFALLRDPNAY